jgi:hypothetical protein
MVRFFAVLILGVGLVGCAGRPPNPTNVVGYTDDKMSCPQLAVSITEQERRAQASYLADKSQEEKNTAIGVAGALLFWPALFAMETGDHNLIEAQAYERRAEHLRRVMISKDCNDIPAPLPRTPPESETESTS